MKRTSLNLANLVYLAVFLAMSIAFIVSVTLLVESCHASPSNQSIHQLCMYILKSGTVVDDRHIYIKIIEPSADGAGENRFYATLTIVFSENGEPLVGRIDFIQEWWGKSAEGTKDIVIQLIVSDLMADGLADMGMCGGMTFLDGQLLVDTRSPLSEQECERQYDRLFYKFFLRCSAVAL